MIIHIEDLKFQCIIGILDFERSTPQDVILNLEIGYEYEKDFINYAEVVNIIKTNMLTSNFLLIEEALKELSENIKKEFPTINTLNIKITKPSILPDCMVSVSNKYKFES